MRYAVEGNRTADGRRTEDTPHLTTTTTPGNALQVQCSSTPGPGSWQLAVPGGLEVTRKKKKRRFVLRCGGSAPLRCCEHEQHCPRFVSLVRARARGGAWGCPVQCRLALAYLQCDLATALRCHKQQRFNRPASLSSLSSPVRTLLGSARSDNNTFVTASGKNIASATRPVSARPPNSCHRPHGRQAHHCPLQQASRLRRLRPHQRGRPFTRCPLFS
jgi:hypothetical protein